MARSELIITEKNIQNVIYRNAIVSKVHDGEIYDVKFATGRVYTFVENTSVISFNSGDYVAVLLSKERESEICKIIGRGKRIQLSNIIPIVRV